VVQAAGDRKVVIPSLAKMASDVELSELNSYLADPYKLVRDAACEKIEKEPDHNRKAQLMFADKHTSFVGLIQVEKNGIWHGHYFSYPILSICQASTPENSSRIQRMLW
jgi:hypothetical protein